MAITIEAWFDYRCPLSMLTRRLLTPVAASHGAVPRWHPHEKQDGQPWDPMPSARVWRHGVRPLADRLGVAVAEDRPAPASSSRLAFHGYQFALEQGCAEAYSDEVFAAQFAAGLDIGDPRVLTAAAERAGLAPRDFHAALLSGHYADRHRAALASGAAYGPIRLTPTTVIGERRIEGVPDLAQLDRLITRAQLAEAAAPVVVQAPVRGVAPSAVPAVLLG